MKLKALKDNVILLYTSPPATIKREDGLIVLSEEFRRDMTRGKSKVISSDNPPPDIYRIGKVISSGLPLIKEGKNVLYNKHNCESFILDRKTYFRIKANLILAYV